MISKGDFKKRSQVIENNVKKKIEKFLIFNFVCQPIKVKITDGDLAEILTLEMGDAKLGKEAPITDDELRNVLDRDWVCFHFLSFLICVVINMFCFSVCLLQKVVNNFDKEMANKEGGKGAAGFEVMREFQAKF